MIQEKLEKIKSGDSNLYQHIVKVLRQMLLNNDKESFRLFENYSQQIKSGYESSSPFRIQQFQELKQYVEKMKAIIDKPNTGTEQQPAQPGPTGYVPNLAEQAEWFEKCGVGFGEELTYTIFKSLEKFSITKQIKELKFWGKIMGRNADYYIAESPAEAGEEELPPGVEPKGTGINKWTYWVSTDLNGQWKELPIISHHQLVVSRRIKYIFTGDLDRQIFTNPQFVGKQAHLLKCQIIRMAYSCSLAPRTMYNVNPQDKKEIDPPAQEWKMPGFQFLCKLANWVHHPQNILKNGRMTILMPEPQQGVEIDEEKVKKELQQQDPMEERLKAISQDKTCKNKAAWSIKTYGDCSQYRAMSKNKQTVNNGYICLRSLVWKGWHTVYHNKQWINIYIGYGIKSTDSFYFPKEPDTVLQQCRDNQEQSQPNFPVQVEKKQGDQPQNPDGQ